MSVQVRRRREAATFLASFVGAQGELLVDTTNNRVQVHDGTVPGGWAAARVADLPGRNAGINTNFAINQRGYASGTALAAGAYGHDRHKAGSGGCTYSFTQAVPDTPITITAGTLIQSVDAPNVYAAACWLTWTGTATARVWQGSASGSFSAGTPTTIDGVTVNALLATGLTIGVIVNIEWSTGTLGTTRPWQFEAALPNAGPTRFERRHGEMLLCQRYYFRRASSGGQDVIGMGQAFSGTQVFGIVMPLPVPMRATPSLGLSSPSHVAGFSLAGGGPFAFGAGGPAYVSPYSFAFNFSGAPAGSFTAGNAVMCCFDTASGWADASAEL